MFLFGQVSGFELNGKGSTSIVSLESATAPTERDMKDAVKYGKAMIKGKEMDNELIDFDMPGNADLPMINVGPRIQVDALVVDGDLGGFTDVDSNLKNAFVSGDINGVGIIAGKSLINAYFGGDVAQISAMKTVKNLHVEGDLTQIAGTKFDDIDIEGDCDDITAYKINGMFVAGDVDNIFLSGGGKYAGIINDSYLVSTNGAGSLTTNFDWVGENGTNDIFNPVKISDSIVGEI